MKTNKGFMVPLLLAIIALLAIGGGVYIYKNKKAEVPARLDVVQVGQSQIYTEAEILANLKSNWPTIQATFKNRPGHPGTPAWKGPYAVQFIGNNNLFVDYEDGSVASINILSYSNGNFKTLETFNNHGLFTFYKWRDLIKKYGDLNYPISSYSINTIKDNKIITFSDLTKVPENVFVKDVPPTSQATPTLLQGDAYILARNAWGDCTQTRECQKMTVTISKQGEVSYVTALYEGLHDDSVGAEKKVAPANYSNGVWTVGRVTVTQQCQPGRGHQDFSTALCL